MCVCIVLDHTTGIDSHSTHRDSMACVCSGNPDNVVIVASKDCNTACMKLDSVDMLRTCCVDNYHRKLEGKVEIHSDEKQLWMES